MTLSDWKDTSWAGAVGTRFQTGFDALGCAHTLYAGARYQREWIPSWSIDSAPPATRLQDNEYTLETLSFHVDDTFSPAEDWTVQLGVRGEWIPTAEGENTVGGATFTFDEDFAALLPGAGVSWRFADSWAVFASWFQGFRAPQVWGFGLTPDPANAELEFEEASALELGVRHAGDHGLAASAVLWRNEYDDFGRVRHGLLREPRRGRRRRRRPRGRVGRGPHDRRARRALGSSRR